MIEPGTFICFQGTLGSGKTLSMSRMGYLARQAGQQVYANYPTTFAKEITSITHLFELRNAVLLLDELQSILDSREFGKNVSITQWIVIVRKLGLSILYTTQFVGQVDLRVRHVTEWIYNCQKLPKKHGRKRTLVDVYKWLGEGGEHSRRYILPHTPGLYSLYDSFDYQVKLTKEGRTATFDASAIN